MTRPEVYPITIVFDRYGGTYSGAKFTAWNLYVREMPEEIGGDDWDCGWWWGTPESERPVCGKGGTPDEAWMDLERKINP
jgi:hypothetical protein